jgi:hypothetical protein
MHTWLEIDCRKCGQPNWFEGRSPLNMNAPDVTQIQCVHCGHKFDLLDDPDVVDEGVCVMGMQEPMTQQTRDWEHEQNKTANPRSHSLDDPPRRG